MSSVGWVVVPSVWWENSPVVIEEAFHSGRPVICSDIGGMKEKVQHQVNGLHFRVKDPQDLAHTLLKVSETPDLWNKLRMGVRKIPSLAESADLHMACYQKFSQNSPALVPA
jgi:glycosyltransferase involved in cell wall biosynthesis